MCRVPRAELTAVAKEQSPAAQTESIDCPAEDVVTVLAEAIAVSVAKWANLPPSRAIVNREPSNLAISSPVKVSREPSSRGSISLVKVSRAPFNRGMSNRGRASREVSSPATANRVIVNLATFSREAETRDHETRNPEVNSHEADRDASVPAGRL